MSYSSGSISSSDGIVPPLFQSSCCHPNKTAVKVAILALTLLFIAAAVSVGIWGDLFLPQAIATTVPRAIIATLCTAFALGLSLELILSSIRRRTSHQEWAPLRGFSTEPYEVSSGGEIEDDEVDALAKWSVEFQSTVAIDWRITQVRNNGQVVVAVGDKEFREKIIGAIGEGPEPYKTMTFLTTTLGQGKEGNFLVIIDPLPTGKYNWWYHGLKFPNPLVVADIGAIQATIKEGFGIDFETFNEPVEIYNAFEKLLVRIKKDTI